MGRLKSGDQKIILRPLNIGLMKCGRAKCKEAEETRKDLQGHSGRNPIDPTLKDNVLIPDNFFEYIYHLGFAIISHPITNSEIDTRRAKSKQGKTDGTLYSR